MATERIPPTLIVALAPHHLQKQQGSSPSPASSLPVASSAYLVRLSSSNHNTPSPSARSSDSVDPSSAMAAITLSPAPTPPPAAPFADDTNMQNRHSSASSTDNPDFQSSDEGGGQGGYNQRDSFAKSSAAGGGNRLGTVSENGEAPGGAGYYRRESHTSTFGRGISGPNSPEPSDRARSMDRRASPSLLGEEQLTPGRPSLAASDALRRQSLLSNVDPLRSKEILPPSEKQELARPSYDEPDTRHVSGSYRLTLKTTNESTNGYTGYGSSNGHSDFKKANHPHIPRSSYYLGPPAIGSAFGTDPMGEIGYHFPREVIRVERDYSGGELVQFYPTYPLEFEGRITPNKFQASINEINEVLISAYSLRYSAMERVLGVATLYLSDLLLETHYDKEMRRLSQVFDTLNKELYNPAGLNLLWPRKVGFLFLEIEYY